MFLHQLTVKSIVPVLPHLKLRDMILIVVIFFSTFSRNDFDGSKNTSSPATTQLSDFERRQCIDEDMLELLLKDDNIDEYSLEGLLKDDYHHNENDLGGWLKDDDQDHYSLEGSLKDGDHNDELGLAGLLNYDNHETSRDNGDG